MVIRELSKTEAIDLVIGAKILANGGGGSEMYAKKVINILYNEGRNLRLASLEEFEEEDYICIIGLVGGGITEKEKKLVQNLKITTNNPMKKAVEKLEDYMGVKFKGFVATELGPSNSIIPLVVASQLSNKVGIDGDCCGRSKPQISISTTTVGKIPISPYSIVSEYGDHLIVERTINDTRGELIARTISKISNGLIGVARCPMQIVDAKRVIISNTISLAIDLGGKVREANVINQDPIKVIKSALQQSQIVFKGKVKNFIRKEGGGFTTGEIVLQSSKDPQDELHIFYKNEYLLTWLNQLPFITCPDSIIIVDAFSGHGLTPWEEDFYHGRDIVVFSIDAPEIWTSPQGLEIFGPKVFDATWKKYTPASRLTRNLRYKLVV